MIFQYDHDVIFQFIKNFKKFYKAFFIIHHA